VTHDTPATLVVAGDDATTWTFLADDASAEPAPRAPTVTGFWPAWLADARGPKVRGRAPSTTHKASRTLAAGPALTAGGARG
jgi:hypothetical protein